jgi:hypothetical protein
MAEKGLPTHLIRTVRSMYQNTSIIIRKSRINGNTPIQINKGTDTDISDWLQVIKQNTLANDLTLNMMLFADDQVIVESTYDELQKAAYTLNNIAIKYTRVSQ